jgi:hypothetical protein
MSRRTALVVALAFSALAAGRAAASETEAREFTITIDGTNAGTYSMTVTKQDDGILSMQGVASITYKHIFGTYRYSYQGVEHWKDGRLLELASKCEDDGKKAEVSARAERDVLKVKINGAERNCRWDVWTTSYWQLADKRFHNQKVPLLDADTGKEYIAELKYIGIEALMVGGQAQNCFHFRVTGGPTTPLDLWYDAQHRLVRQEFLEQRKKVVFNLQTVRH